MPEDLPDIPHSEILRYEEILRICAAAARLGIANFRVTGGEPLVRLGCIDLLRSMKGLPGVGKIMITTNGVALERHVQDFCDIGIASVNISLDTLDREAYRQITGADALDKVLAGIDAALEAGLRIKINCVAMRGVNEGAYLPLAAMAAERHVDVRFIESMPIGAGSGFAMVPVSEIIGRLSKAYPGMAETGERLGFGPAVYYKSPGMKGSIGLISAISHAFCESCNRIRLTSDGLLKTCLYYGQALDLKPTLRQGANEDTLCEAIRGAVAHKQEHHRFNMDMYESERRKMSQIGG
jgi:cyclic pyranopterin phosphate synthase